MIHVRNETNYSTSLNKFNIFWLNQSDKEMFENFFSLGFYSFLDNENKNYFYFPLFYSVFS